MEEVKALEERNGGGNKVAKETWLANVPDHERPTPDVSPPQAYKRFVERAYIDKLWVGSPSAPSPEDTRNGSLDDMTKEPSSGKSSSSKRRDRSHKKEKAESEIRDSSSHRGGRRRDDGETSSNRSGRRRGRKHDYGEVAPPEGNHWYVEGGGPDGQAVGAMEVGMDYRMEAGGPIEQRPHAWTAAEYNGPVVYDQLTPGGPAYEAYNNGYNAYNNDYNNDYSNGYNAHNGYDGGNGYDYGVASAPPDRAVQPDAWVQADGWGQNDAMLQTPRSNLVRGMADQFFQNSMSPSTSQAVQAQTPSYSSLVQPPTPSMSDRGVWNKPVLPQVPESPLAPAVDLRGQPPSWQNGRLSLPPEALSMTKQANGADIGSPFWSCASNASTSKTTVRLNPSNPWASSLGGRSLTREVKLAPSNPWLHEVSDTPKSLKMFLSNAGSNAGSNVDSRAGSIPGTPFRQYSSSNYSTSCGVSDAWAPVAPPQAHPWVISC